MEEKIETFLSIQYIAQNAKWEMKRKNSFLLIFESDFNVCQPVTLNLYFSLLPDYKALFIVISWKLMRNIGNENIFNRLGLRSFRKYETTKWEASHQPRNDSVIVISWNIQRRSAMSNLAFSFLQHPYVCGSLNKFIVHHVFRSVWQTFQWLHANQFMEISLLLFISIEFFAQKSPHWNDKRLCIHQVYVSMELFNFPLVVVVFL